MDDNLADVWKSNLENCSFFGYELMKLLQLKFVFGLTMFFSQQIRKIVVSPTVSPTLRTILINVAVLTHSVMTSPPNKHARKTVYIMSNIKKNSTSKQSKT